MFVVVAFAIFTGALLVAAYYAWSIPQQQENDAISNRLRELRVKTGAPRRMTGADLLRTENKGTFAFMGEFMAWFRVLGRLQEMIDQANLKYRAVDVMVVSLILFVATYLATGLFGLNLVMLQFVLGIVVGAIPVVVVMRTRS